MDLLGHLGAEIELTIGATRFVNGFLKSGLDDFTEQVKETHKIAFATTVGANQDIDITQRKVSQRFDRFKSFQCDFVD